MVASEPLQNNAAGEARPGCPSCGSTEFKRFLPAGRIHREAVFRERFVLERFNRQPRRSELKDLTDFAHGEDTAILSCAECGVLRRDDPAGETSVIYADDAYDAALIDRVFPRYVAAFRAKSDPYRGLLEPGAHIAEIGSHYGAFLQVALEWGWQATGVDIGKDTSRYAQSRGYTVCQQPLEKCGFADRAFDGVFVWNCFEQVPEPRPLLREIRRVARPGALVVVRTPNAFFYEMCESMLGASEFALKAMAYNNLLGFPYLYGYSSRTLNQLVASEGFEVEGMLNSELITLPLPEMPDWVAEESAAVSAAIRKMNEAAPQGLLTGPWIELYYRVTATPL